MKEFSAQHVQPVRVQARGHNNVHGQLFIQFIITISVLIIEPFSVGAFGAFEFVPIPQGPNVYRNHHRWSPHSLERTLNNKARFGLYSSTIETQGIAATATATSTNDAGVDSVEVPAPIAVDRVNICMGELCKCQEEGNNAESIMADLQSRDINFDVEEAPCLGACGLGSMVSIEYENGDYDLVTGLEETLEAVGLVTTKMKIDKVQNLENHESDEKVNHQEDTLIDVNNGVNNEISTNESQRIQDDMLNEVAVEAKAVVEVKAEIETIEPELKIKVEDEHDAIKRMRAESTQDKEEKINPWMNMALYIGKKVSDSVMK
jgi:hypothetical protein